MSETCQKLAFTHPIAVLQSELKNNWMKKLDRVNLPQKLLTNVFRNEAMSVSSETNERICSLF